METWVSVLNIFSSRLNLVICYITLHVTTKLLPYFLFLAFPLSCCMKEFLVNLDPVVLELMYETKYLKKMHFEVPDVVFGLCADEEQIKRHQLE